MCARRQTVGLCFDDALSEYVHDLNLHCRLAIGRQAEGGKIAGRQRIDMMPKLAGGQRRQMLHIGSRFRKESLCSRCQLAAEVEQSDVFPGRSTRARPCDPRGLPVDVPAAAAVRGSINPLLFSPSVISLSCSARSKNCL